MKNLKYIVILGGLLVFSSCKKENIQPHSATDSGLQSPEWESSAMMVHSSSQVDIRDRILTGADKNQSSNDVQQGTITSDVTGGTLGTGDSTGGITDPNNDPDASKRKGKK